MTTRPFRLIEKVPTGYMGGANRVVLATFSTLAAAERRAAEMKARCVPGNYEIRERGRRGILGGYIYS